MKIITIIIIGTVLFIALPGCTQKTVETAPEINSYLACDCGCCGGVEPAERCLYESRGDDLNEIIENNKKISQSKECELMGCSTGVRYMYCD